MTTPSFVTIIEDDVDERTALSRVLKAGGFDVVNYASAEDYLSSRPPEPMCLVLDMQLKGMSGLELLRELRADTPTLPVVVVTASDDASLRYEAEQLGCVAYFRKPFQGRALVAFLRSLA